VALKSLKAWWRRRQLQRRGIAADPHFHPIAAGGRAGWDGWRVVPDQLNRDSIVYSFGIGNDASFDLALIERFGLQVHGFDPTPESMAWVKEQNLPPQFIFHPLGLAAHDGVIRLYPPRRPGKVNFSQERLEYVTANHEPIEAAVARLPTIMRQLGHTQVDVLKIDIEGSEFEAVPDFLASGCSIGQLLVEVHYHYPTRSLADGVDLIQRITASGLRCFHVSPRGLEFGFVRA
jgi:FkbM family methyltransferase